MSNIPFMQYLRPNGRKRAVMIDRPEHIAQAATKIIEHGFWFTVEQLGDSKVSFTITDHSADHAIEVCMNNEQVPIHVDKLIAEFDLGAALKRREKLG